MRPPFPSRFSKEFKWLQLQGPLGDGRAMGKPRPSLHGFCLVYQKRDRIWRKSFCALVSNEIQSNHLVMLEYQEAQVASVHT